MKTIAVFGSKGVLGSVFCNLLKEKYIVHEFYRRNSADLSNVWNFKSEFETDKFKFDAVINCASSGGGLNLKDVNNTSIQNNLKIFHALKSLSDRYGVLINIGSGIEFGTGDLQFKKEEDILNVYPYESGYALSKNIISRECLNMDNARTLRIFGCFSSNEPNYRLLRKFVDSRRYNITNSNNVFNLPQNKLFSWISSYDLTEIIDQTINNWKDIPNDINCCYDPITNLDFLKLYCKLHNIKHDINSFADGGSYTGNNDYMKKFFTIKYGLEHSLLKYV